MAKEPWEIDWSANQPKTAQVKAPAGKEPWEIDYQKLETQKQKNDKVRERLRQESWASRNIEGVATAPSNLIEGVKQGAYDISNPQQYINPKTGETSLIPYEGYQRLPKKQYDTSKIQENRVIAQEAPVGAIAGNVATALPLAFIPGVNRTAGSMLAGGTLSALQPTLGNESRAENAVTGALVSGLVPNAAKIAEPTLRYSANRLMQSAIKPQIKYLEAGKVPSAIETMFEYGVNPTQGRTIFGKGLDVIKKDVKRLNSLVDDIIQTYPSVAKTNTALTEIEKLRPKIIAAGGDATELDALTKFITQKQANPLLAGDTISLPAAQQMKQAIYEKIGDTAYLTSPAAANIQGEKALAKGLRQSILEAAPEVAPLNAQEAKAINALKVSERRALNEANKDIMGLGNLTPSIEKTLLFLADRSAGMKSIVARMLNQAKRGVQALPSVDNKGLLGVPASQVTNVTREPRE